MKCLFMLFLITTLHGYRNYIKPNVKLNWQSASQYCINTYGTSLATISNEIENTQAKGVCIASNYDPAGCWIGLNDRSREGRYRWISGASVTYTDWSISPWIQPDNGNGNGQEDCVHIWSENDAWNDWDCSSSGYFLCDAPTESPTIATQTPSYIPSGFPSNNPTNYPSIFPSDYPTNIPTNIPTYNPTIIPSITPTMTTTTVNPSIPPTNAPSESRLPTIYPTINPTNNVTIIVPIVNNSNPNLINTQMFTILFILVGFLILLVLCLAIFVIKKNRQFKGDNIHSHSYPGNDGTNNIDEWKNTDDTNIQDTASVYNDKEGISGLKSNKSSDIESLYGKKGKTRPTSIVSSNISDIFDDSDTLAMKGEPQIQSNISSNVSELYHVSYNVNTNGNTLTKESKNRNGYV